jgi:arginine deiminase
MIFTMIDRELCCVFPPHFKGPTRLPVMHLTRGVDTVRERDDLFAGLRAVGLPLEPIFCGGPRRNQQEREQWGSGCNMVAVAPGHLIAYARNDQTLRALSEDGGFDIMSSEQLRTAGELPAAGSRAVITFRGSELVRGGGGPRCMTLPVRRAAVAW